MANDKQQPRNDSEQVRLKKEEQARKAKRTSRQLLGLALTVLIIVGAASIVKSGVDLIKNALDTTSEQETYQRLLTPFVYFDVLPFESLQDVGQNDLKQVAIWGVMDQLGAELTRDEMGQPLVPAVEVDRYAATLFGPNFKFDEHAGFTDKVFDLTYGFDDVNEVYIIPSTGLQPPYLPKVVDIQRERGGVKRVVMGYINTRGSNNELINDPSRNVPDRYMDFMFQRDGGQYYLFAIQKNTTYVPPVSSSDVQAGQSSSLPPDESSSLVELVPAEPSQTQTESGSEQENIETDSSSKSSSEVE